MMEIFDGRLMETQRVFAEPDGASGVFETLLLRAGEPQFFEQHFARYLAGCAHFGLTGTPGREQLCAGAAELVRVNALRDGVLRWSVWREDGGLHWHQRVESPRPHTAKPTWSVTIWPKPIPAFDRVAQFKHLGRRLWREARAGARAQGFDEVLLQDSAGRIVEGAGSNLFCVSGAIIRTPSLDCGPLPGVARAQVLKLGRALGLPVVECDLAAADLLGAQEVFLTNSLVGIRPVSALDGVPLPLPGPVTMRLQSAWLALPG